MTVRVRLADGTEINLPSDTGTSTAGQWRVRIGDRVREGVSPHPRPLGEDPPEPGFGHFSAPGVLGTYLPGSVVRIHREDANRTAYVVEVVENADPTDHAGNPIWDDGARAPSRTVKSFGEFNVRRHGNEAQS